MMQGSSKLLQIVEEPSFSFGRRGFHVFNSLFWSSMHVPACFLVLLTIMVNLPDQRLLGFYDHSGLIPIFVIDFGSVSRLVSGS